MTDSIELRQKFLDFFGQRGHTIVKSDLLVPSSDPTLLFTSAGMVQFKDYFLGKKSIGNNRAVTCQKCFRTSDIDRIGHTARHLSFFEMLGNFSFGDYFKQDAVAWGWEFLTKTAGLPADKLHITIYKDDDEAFNIWKKIVPENRIYRLGDDTNFWTMGPTGPCGPCSEILFDFGDQYKCLRPVCDPSCDCDRWLEVWNLVFTQYNRDETGKLDPLPRKNIDTGMGLERLTAVSNNFRNVFQTDLFETNIKEAEKLFMLPYPNRKDEINTAYRMISDHIRAVTFLIGDGILPSNEGRGYVLRRILRRAVRQGKLLKHDEPFMYQLVGKQIELVQKPYPELAGKKENIVSIVKMEEEKFFETLNTGLSFLENIISQTKKTGMKTVPGKKIFELYDTYGFPPELSKEILVENGLLYSEEEFDEQKQKSVQIARQSWKGSGQADDLSKDTEYAGFIKELELKGVKTVFVGYSDYETETEIAAIYKNIVVLNKTSFYAEMGGQVADTGVLTAGSNTVEVVDTQSPVPGLVIHKLKTAADGFGPGSKVTAKVDIERRKSIMRNHTATHLLHKALREVIGSHAVQSGSLVQPDRFRFDFSHFRALSDDDLKLIEDKVQTEIMNCLPVRTVETTPGQAREWGAMALFGEKYGDKVRCVITGGTETDFKTAYSIELCGGTHVHDTGELGYFRIVSESSIGSGLRRIEAVTGVNSVKLARSADDLIKELSYKLKSTGTELVHKVDGLIQKQKQMEREITDLKTRPVTGQTAQKNEHDIKGVKLIIQELDNIDSKSLRVIADKVKDQVKTNAVILVTNKTAEKMSFVLTLTKDVMDEKKIDLRELGNKLSELVDGSCGGRPDFVQGGSNKPVDDMANIIARFVQLIKQIV
jgi:alanyl-tRNA synthetase